MRIIAGKYRHIVLEAPPGLNTRPTLDRVKEALFSIINFKINGKVVLDLFAGSGALGIEALSRGAHYVYFNDFDKLAQSAIKQNLAKLKDCQNYEIYQSDYLDIIHHKNNSYDIILLDPPYKENIYTFIIHELLEYNRLNPWAIIVIECDAKNSAIQYLGFSQKTYHYGNKNLVILTKES